MAEKSFDIIVWGATGFTGRLVAQHLLRTYGAEGNLKWAMAARNPDKLAMVAKEIGAEDVPHLLANADDRESLDRLAAAAKVIITTVGPYQLYGEKLVAACAEAGTDYVDLCGEPGWMAGTIARYHDIAQRTGARIVHSCGFDSIPFDLGVHYVQKLYREAYGRPAPLVKGVLKGAKGGLSGGTYASLMETVKAAETDQEVRRALGNVYGLAQDSEAKRPRQPDVRKPRKDEDVGAWLAPFIMADINMPNVHRSNMLTDYAYGQDFRYLEMMRVPNRVVAWGLAVGLGSFMSLVKNKSTRGLVQRLLPDPGEGPSEKERESGFFKVLMIAKDEKGLSLRAEITGDKDPGYGGTSRMLSEAAMTLLHHPEGQTGCLTTAPAMGDALIDRLEAHAGLTFRKL
ncbi:saccharopine dehydrogenase [Parvularcula bermudensis HTCC2503]|uniref:Saccharopine dehydrogenase n=1 Tax=Parvularcula bermudensis (strain ATCC BAA-594 / HTCC2503 / KCTC 12087) TaxID=314260 RepID=E0TE98_PARBH|nr:saccharopine dehydrogenase NADP-binding domain-containing protein [Parvularcula bermudensis]ADM09473.1 saccharopine dehydrogenase [Parvularcula bermudensis HTCC2503]